MSKKTNFREILLKQKNKSTQKMNSTIKLIKKLLKQKNLTLNKVLLNKNQFFETENVIFYINKTMHVKKQKTRVSFFW